jgi:hypothetical protein
MRARIASFHPVAVMISVGFAVSAWGQSGSAGNQTNLRSVRQQCLEILVLALAARIFRTEREGPSSCLGADDRSGEFS